MKERLFPCKQDKRPYFNDWPNKATDDNDTLSQWISDYPNCLWGLTTGEGLFVLDVDIKNDGVGLESLSSLTKAFGSLPDTKTVQTASGGLHYYFKFDGEKHTIRNSASRLAKDLDIRGDGGFVIRPNEDTYKTINKATIAEAPGWLVRMVEKREKPERNQIELHKAVVAFNKKNSAADILVGHGYTEQESFGGCRRFLPPGSTTGQAGTILYPDGLVWSNNGSSPLADDNQHDAFDVYKILNYGTDNQAYHNALASINKADTTIFRTSDLLEEALGELHWNIDSILPAGTMLLTAKPKKGKSYLALMMSLCVSAGRTVFGLDSNKGKSLYLGLEDSKRRLQRRIRGVKSILGIKDHGEHYWHTMAPNMNDHKLIEWLEGVMENHPDLRFIVIDMLKNVKGDVPGKDLYKEDAKTGDALTHFCHNYPHLSIMVIHHSNKSTSEDPQDTISGTTGLTGSFDNIAVITDPEDGRMIHISGRDVEMQDIPLIMNEAGSYTLEVERRSDEVEELRAAQLLHNARNIASGLTNDDVPVTQRKMIDLLMAEGYKQVESRAAAKAVMAELDIS